MGVQYRFPYHVRYVNVYRNGERIISTDKCEGCAKNGDEVHASVEATLAREGYNPRPGDVVRYATMADGFNAQQYVVPTAEEMRIWEERKARGEVW